MAMLTLIGVKRHYSQASFDGADKKSQARFDAAYRQTTPRRCQADRHGRLMFLQASRGEENRRCKPQLINAVAGSLIKQQNISYQRDESNHRRYGRNQAARQSSG